jgi:hypothetical protein
MSEQKKTRADVIAEIQKTNDLLQKLLDVMTRNHSSQQRNTRSIASGGSPGCVVQSGGGGVGTAG